MILSIASGKGGTGKTTIATNLAYSLGEKAQILDCDVEEPNAHLFLYPILPDQTKVYAKVPAADMNKCTLCKKCADVCRFNAITVVGKTVLTFPELCHSCNGCILACPEDALTKTNRELGDLEKGYAGSLGFVHGRLRIGEAMSPPLIKKVRAETDTALITIIDAPPGTSCPAIASMKNTDFVLLVTEPTPFGLHDLKLAAEAVKLLKIPAGLVINRSDIGDAGVKNYAMANKLPILMEIPFDRAIAETYSRGGLLAEDAAWKDRFHELYKQIDQLAINGGKK